LSPVRLCHFLGDISIFNEAQSIAENEYQPPKLNLGFPLS